GAPAPLEAPLGDRVVRIEGEGLDEAAFRVGELARARAGDPQGAIGCSARRPECDRRVELLLRRLELVRVLAEKRPESHPRLEVLGTELDCAPELLDRLEAGAACGVLEGQPTELRRFIR